MMETVSTKTALRIATESLAAEIRGYHGAAWNSDLGAASRKDYASGGPLDSSETGSTTGLDYAAETSHYGDGCHKSGSILGHENGGPGKDETEPAESSHFGKYPLRAL
jgi:hypothetical protein